MWASLAKQWFLIALAACFTLGYLGAEQILPIFEMPYLRSCLVFVVMWMMGVTLHADTVKRSFTRPLPSLLAIGLNVVAVPVLCLPTMWLLPDHLFGGLFIASIVPCTLASASVWTRKAGGDDSIAMMTTVVTNLACVAVVPVGILLVLSQETSIDVMEQVKKLSLVVVLPLLIAQVMRSFALSAWADRNKPRLSTLGQIGILAMVVFGAVASAQVVGHADLGGQVEPIGQVVTPQPSQTGLGSIAILILAAATIHTLALMIGVAISWACGVDRARQIAVGIAGSQKTLMVGLQIAIDCGVSVVPMLIYHLSQLVIDTIIAERWKRSENGALEGRGTDRVE